MGHTTLKPVKSIHVPPKMPASNLKMHLNRAIYCYINAEELVLDKN